MIYKKHTKTTPAMMSSTYDNIKQQIDGFLKMAEVHIGQLHSNTCVRGTKKLRKEVAQIVTQLKAITAKALSAAATSSDRACVEEYSIELMRSELMVCGNKLVVVASAWRRRIGGIARTESGRKRSRDCQNFQHRTLCAKPVTCHAKIGLLAHGR